MCLALYRPKGIKLDEAIYREAFKRNDHGGGFAYVEEYEGGETEVVAEKGFMNIEAMLFALKEHEEKEMIIHFRRASAGGISPANCHPFEWTSECFPHFSFALIHNGTLDYRSTATKSDTACFVHDILEPHFDRDPYFLDNAPGMWMLENILGFNNKFVVMRHDSKHKETRVYIVNEKQGEKDLGCWFSNFSYKPLPVYTPYVPPRHGGHGGHGGMYEGYWGDDYVPGEMVGKREEADFRKKRFEERFKLDGWKFNDTSRMWEPPTPGSQLSLPSSNTTSLVCMVIARTLTEDQMKKAKAEEKTDAVKEAQKMDNADARAEGKSIPFPEIEVVPDKPKVDLDLVEEEAWKVATASITPFPKSGSAFPLVGGVPETPKTIEVPRDSEKPKKTYVKGLGLGHLTKKQKCRMKRLCEDYLEATNAPGYKAMHFVEQLTWLREDIRGAIDWLNDLTDEQLDQWMLQKVDQLEEEFRKEKERARVEAARAEVERKRAEAGVTA